MNRADEPHAAMTVKNANHVRDDEDGIAGGLRDAPGMHHRRTRSLLARRALPTGVGRPERAVREGWRTLQSTRSCPSSFEEGLQGRLAFPNRLSLRGEECRIVHSSNNNDN